jgi:hypothetical protein
MRVKWPEVYHVHDKIEQALKPKARFKEQRERVKRLTSKWQLNKVVPSNQKKLKNETRLLTHLLPVFWVSSRSQLWQHSVRR